MLPRSSPATGCSSIRRSAAGRGAGTVVVFREPETGDLAIKRVAARPGDWVPFADGWLQLAEDEAWLAATPRDEALAAGGLRRGRWTRDATARCPSTRSSRGPGSATGRAPDRPARARSGGVTRA